jgi:hypothetical protein
VRNNQGHVTSDKDVTIDGFPGKAITIRTGDGKAADSRG